MLVELTVRTGIPAAVQRDLTEPDGPALAGPQPARVVALRLAKVAHSGPIDELSQKELLHLMAGIQHDTNDFSA